MSIIRVLDAALRPGMSLGIDGRRIPSAWSIELLLDHLPDYADRRYKTLYRNGRTFYVSELDGIANFFVHNPRNQEGYGGRVLTGTLESGEPFSVKGPWSSGSGEINTLGLIPPVIPAAATTSREDWERGYTLFALSGVTMPVIDQALRYLPGWSFGGGDPAPAHEDIGLELSDEQCRAVFGVAGSGFVYESELPPCLVCAGRSFVEAAQDEPDSFVSSRTKTWTKLCPECGNLGVLAGIAPIPGIRWKGHQIVRAC